MSIFALSLALFLLIYHVFYHLYRREYTSFLAFFSRPYFKIFFNKLLSLYKTINHNDSHFVEQFEKMYK